MIYVEYRNLAEPLLPTQPEEIADLSRLVSTPIALGERLYTRSDFRPYLEKRAIDIAQPDVSRSTLSTLCSTGRVLSLDFIFVGLALRWDQRASPYCVTHGNLRCWSGTALPAWPHRARSVHAGGNLCS